MFMDVLETFFYQGCKIFNPNGSKEDWNRIYSYDCTHFPVSIILVKLNVIVDFKFNILFVTNATKATNADRQRKQAHRTFSVLYWLLLLTQRWKYDFMRSVTEQDSVWVGTLDPNPYLVSNESTVIAFIVFYQSEILKSWKSLLHLCFYINFGS